MTLNVWAIRLGLELRQLRKQAGLSGEQAARGVEWHPSTVSRIERAERGIRRARDLDALLGLYQLTDERQRHILHALRRQANHPTQPYIENLGEDVSLYLAMEAEARALSIYETTFIHGLLQTEDYMRATFAAERPNWSHSLMDERVAVRLSRQQLHNTEHPPRICVVLDEAAIRRPVGGSAIMHAQLTHLLHMGEMPHVTIEILPFSAGGYTGMGGTFTLVSLADSMSADVAYTEGPIQGYYVDDAAAIEICSVAFGHMRGTALSDTQSASLIAEVLAGL